MSTSYDDWYKELRAATHGMSVHTSDWTAKLHSALRRRAKRDRLTLSATVYRDQNVVSLSLTKGRA